MPTWWQREIPDVCCKCNPRWHAVGRRFPWCTRFNSWMRPFAASRPNRCGVNPSRKPLLERDAGSLGDVAQLLNDRQNQRDAIFAAPFFRFAFRVAGQEGSMGAGSGFGSAKDADVIVNLTLEGIPVDETVDLQRPKEMSDSVADAALWNFLAKSERRRERSPIRAAENTAEDVHHDGQAVTFMSAAVAVRTERQKRSAGDHVIRIGCGAALTVDGPALGNRVAAPARHFDFSVGGSAGGHVNHNGRLFLAGETDGNGVSAEHAFSSPQRRDQLG